MSKNKLWFEFDVAFSIIDAEVHHILINLNGEWRAEIVNQRMGSTIWELKSCHWRPLGTLSIRERPAGCVLEFGGIPFEKVHDEFDLSEREESLGELVDLIISGLKKISQSGTKKKNKSTSPKREADREKWDFIKKRIIAPLVESDPSLLEKRSYLINEVKRSVEDSNFNNPNRLPDSRYTITKVVDEYLKEI